MIRSYKIRRKDGLFSTGGTYPRFTSRGKSWSHLGHVKSHLHQIPIIEIGELYKDCDLILLEYVEKEVVAMKDFVKTYSNEVIKREKLKEEQANSYAKARRYDMYLKLKQEFSN